MRVLIAVDGSAGSFEAVDQIGRVLSGERDEVALYYSPPALRLRATSTDPKVLAEAQDALAQAVFEEAKKRLPPTLQAKARTIAGLQDVRNGILVEADGWSADLVSLGARGLTTLKRLLLGSVSRTIVHRSTRPVWVARTLSHQRHRGLNVLLACENEACRPAAELLTKFTWPEGTHFTALSVVPSIFAGRVPEWLEQKAHSPEVEAMVQAWAREHDEDLAARHKSMEASFRTLPPPLANCRTLVTEGETAREILATIHNEHIDLAVVGTKRARSVASIFLGGTSDAVLNHAECSVLVVPQ